MTYTKNTWVDQVGQVRYSETTDSDNLKIFTANYEQVTVIGTPVNADNMNHIEQGIYDCYAEIDNKINTMLQTIYPIGSIYVSTSSTNPLESLFGTWELVAEGRTLQGADENHLAGTTIAAGLPNIKATMRFNGTDPERASASSTGCVTTSYWKTGGNDHDANISHGGVVFDFDASRSSSIYSDSVSTVQTNAYVVNIWRRVA